MVDKEKLASYSKKYEEIKEDVVEASILKGELERQQEESDNIIATNANDIKMEKAILWDEKVQQLKSQKKKLKMQIKLKMIVSSIIALIIMCFGYLVANLPLITAILIAIIISTPKIISDIAKYQRENKKCSIINVSKNDLIDDKITELICEQSKEIEKNIAIRKSLYIIEERLNKLGELKLDIENLIICLFSSLDNIIRNKRVIKKKKI